MVTLSIQSSNFKATTSTRREITIGTTFGAVVDFGIIDVRGNSVCARADQATATVIAATATTVANATTTAIVATSIASGGSSTGTGPNGQPLPPAVATAVAAGATATAQRFTPTPIPTPVPTATPLATTRLTAAYPRTARFLMQAVAKYPDGRRTDMLAEGALIGLETVVFQDSGQRVGSEQVSMRIKRNEQVDDIVVTAQDAYRQRSTEDNWRRAQYDEVRNDLGLLAPLDALVALRCVSRGQDGGQAVVDGVVTRYILGEVDTLRFWETSIRPALRRRLRQQWRRALGRRRPHDLRRRDPLGDRADHPLLYAARPGPRRRRPPSAPSRSTRRCRSRRGLASKTG